MILDLITILGGLILPPAVDFIKKKFIPGEADTPERTASTLATTKPEVLAPYIDATSKLQEVGIKFFNRDVIGEPSKWVVNLRAAIRPITVIVALAMLIADGTSYLDLVDGSRLTCEALASSWFGSRITLR